MIQILSFTSLRGFRLNFFFDWFRFILFLFVNVVVNVNRIVNYWSHYSTNKRGGELNELNVIEFTSDDSRSNSSCRIETSSTNLSKSHLTNVKNHGYCCGKVFAYFFLENTGHVDKDNEECSKGFTEKNSLIISSVGQWHSNNTFFFDLIRNSFWNLYKDKPSGN